MDQRKSLSRGDYILLVLFLAIVIASIIPVLTNIAFIEMVPEHMALFLIILVSISTMMAGVIFTNSLARFTIERRLRNLVLIFLAVNIILTFILYLVTNVSMEALSPFTDKARNRTVIVAFVLVLAPSILFGKVSEEIDLDKKRIITIFLWGGILCPLVTIWFFLSPVPVFITAIPGEGLTFTSVLLLIILFPIFAVAFWKYYTSWQRERNRLDLASLLSILLWLFATVLLGIQSNPLQVIELIWFSVFISGELLITLVTISSEIIEPQKSLRSLVEIRTEELFESKKESEFYLNLWGHKIGNLLQSLMLYLEIFSMGDKSAEELTSLAETALDIGHEVDQINKQVSALIKLKEKEMHELVLVNLADTIKSSVKIAEETFGSSCFSKWSEYLIDTVYVRGDEFFEIALVNLFSFICRHEPPRKILIYPKVSAEKITIQIDFDEPRLPKDIEDSLFSALQPTRTTMSLDLFIVKILMERYGGAFDYLWQETSKKNRFLLSFNRDLSNEIERSLE